MILHNKLDIQEAQRTVKPNSCIAQNLDFPSRPLSINRNVFWVIASATEYQERCTGHVGD
ncbi:hypothetical protein J6590_001209 [Homalodisca vitripennis]|nr:hypothetical protein J6590_001209 [Homalodisca vitripennis]